MAIRVDLFIGVEAATESEERNSRRMFYDKVACPFHLRMHGRGGAAVDLYELTRLKRIKWFKTCVEIPSGGDYFSYIKAAIDLFTLIINVSMKRIYIVTGPHKPSSPSSLKK